MAEKINQGNYRFFHPQELSADIEDLALLAMTEEELDAWAERETRKESLKSAVSAVREFNSIYGVRVLDDRTGEEPKPKVYGIDSGGSIVVVECPVDVPPSVRDIRARNQRNFLGYTRREERTAEMLIEEMKKRASLPVVEQGYRDKPLDEVVDV